MLTTAMESITYHRGSLATALRNVHNRDGLLTTAMNFLAASRSFFVRFLVLGPISRTTSVGLMLDFCTMESMSKGFLRMCWPLDLWKEIPPWYDMCCCAFAFSFFTFPPATQTRCTVLVQRAHTSARRNTE